jgi:hypothetical protein
MLDEISPGCAAAADRVAADIRTRLSPGQGRRKTAATVALAVAPRTWR